jgi:hypothetical protein
MVTEFSLHCDGRKHWVWLSIFPQTRLPKSDAGRVQYGLKFAVGSKGRTIRAKGLCAAKLSRSRGYEMSIKSDKWIRTQAVENKMIEPFCEKQVRKASSPTAFVLRLRPAGLE